MHLPFPEFATDIVFDIDIDIDMICCSHFGFTKSTHTTLPAQSRRALTSTLPLHMTCMCNLQFQPLFCSCWLLAASRKWSRVPPGACQILANHANHVLIVVSSLLPWFSSDGKTGWWKPAKNHVVPKQCYSTVPQCEDGIEVSNLFPPASYSPCFSAIWALSRVVAVPHGYCTFLHWSGTMITKNSQKGKFRAMNSIKKQTFIKVREKQSNHSHWYHFHHCQTSKAAMKPPGSLVALT